MAIYQKTLANLGVKLEITHASPDIANNRTTITYKASVYKIGSHNPFNNYSQTPMYLTINGQPLHSTATGNYDLRGGTYQQVIKTGTLVVPHNTDGSKSFTFSWNVNFTSTGYGYGNVTTSGTYVLPNIARASTFTIPNTTITTGSAFTVTINKASDGFRHKVAYIVGSSVNEWITNADKTYSATIPHSLFNAYKSVESVAGVIRVTTMNGTTEVGSNQIAVTINLTSGAIPSLGTISNSNTNRYVFTSDEQFVRGMSRLTCTANSAIGSYSSSISAYEFRVLRANGTTTFGTTSKTSNTHQFAAFDFPASSSEVVTPQVRVKDSRGRYSAWKNASVIRVHYYAPPAIGTMTVRRTGSGNTTLQVTRNYSISLLYQGGTGSNLNTASLWFQHRTKGSTSASNNTGAKSTTTSLTNSNANLAGTFAANTSYEVRAILDDGVAGRVIGSWISVGTEFVPMDIGPKGVGVGKVHSDSSVDLEVGSGGIKSEGDVTFNKKQWANIYTGNLNDIDRTWVLTNVGSTNLPPGSDYWYVKTIWYSPTNRSQFAIGYNHSGMAQRHIANTTTWSPWVEVLTGPTIKNGINTISNYDQMTRMQTPHGYIDLGPSNSTYAHIYTDRSSFYFNKEMLVNGNRVVKVNELPSNVSAGGGVYYQTGKLLICTIRFDLNVYYSSYTLTRRWTYPKAFASAPTIILNGRTNIGHMESTNGAELNGTLQTYAETASYCDIAWFRQGGSAYVNGNTKYINAIAIGYV